MRDTLLQIVNHIITQHPILASEIESLAALAQGKGFGAASIELENEIVHHFLKKNPVIAIDIGGNVGNYTAELRRRNANVEIHVFEPAFTNIEKLNKRFFSDSMVKINPIAISDKTSSAILFSDSPGSGLGSLTKRRLDHFNIDFGIKETIKTICFEDYWINSLGKRTLDIVKMDIEGHEFSALKGFGEAIHNTNVVQFEFGGANIDTRTYFQDFWYFFQTYNFDIFRIIPTGFEPVKNYKESCEYFSTTNYVAVNKNLS